MAAAYLAGYLKSKRGDLDQHDVVSAEDLAELQTTADTADLLLRSDPEIIALSVYVWNAHAVSDLLSELRRRSPEVTIVLGGPDVQYTPQTALRRFDADYVCAGEGEAAFLALVWGLESRRGSIRSNPPPGIVSRSGDGGPARLVEDLDALPSPFRDRIVSIPAGGWVDIETVRGCPFSCSFCLYGKNLRSLRAFSPERIHRDLDWLLGHGATDIYFLDPTFNLPRPHCGTVLDSLTALNQDRRARIYVEARAEAIDDDLAGRFAAAGIRSVEVGLQATDSTALRLMHRGLGRERFLEGCRRLRDKGIAAEIGIIIGLPGDSTETIDETIAFATQDLVAEVSAYRLRVLPGSDYWQRAAELGLEFASEPPYFVSSTPLLSPRQLGAIESSAMDRLAAHNERYRASLGQDTESRVSKTSKKDPVLSKKEPTAEPIGV